jgi:hypothetical protein
MHTLTENPLETRVENTAYSIIRSVEYSVKYTRQTDVTQHVNQLDNSWIPRGPQPKGQGPWPLAKMTWASSQSSAHVRKHPMGLIPRGHNRKVIVTVSGLNGMGSRGSGNRASTSSLPLKGFALWFFLSGDDKEEVRGESESASRART